MLESASVPSWALNRTKVHTIVFRLPPYDTPRAARCNKAKFRVHRRPSTSCTGVYLAITMLQYYICLGIVLTVILVLGLGLGFGIILYIVIGT